MPLREPATASRCCAPSRPGSPAVPTCPGDEPRSSRGEPALETGLEDGTRHRSSHGSSSPPSFHDHGNGYFRLLERSESDEPCVVLPSRSLRGSALAGDFDSVEAQAPPRSDRAVDDAAHRLLDNVQRPCGNPFYSLRCRGRACHVGGNQVTPIGQGGDVPGHLQCVARKHPVRLRDSASVRQPTTPPFRHSTGARAAGRFSH